MPRNLFLMKILLEKRFVSLVTSVQDPSLDTNARRICYPVAYLIIQGEQAFCLLLLFSTFQYVMDGICSIGREMLVQ